MNIWLHKVLFIILPKSLQDLLIFLRVKVSAERKVLDKFILPFFAGSKIFSKNKDQILKFVFSLA